ncbi:MAG: zinc-binding dehydrogenase [Actinobacteria bacterium]|nr:zinc-binding dehydrogenase [Actinomycetota bacterium]
MKALVFERKPAKYAAAMAAGKLVPGGGAKVGPLRLRGDHDVPDLPGPGWHYVKPRLAGICGSDLATIDGRSSRYFEPIVSFPFVPGHEVVADLVDPGDPKAEPDGSYRVVLEPVLGCVTRGIEPVCRFCERGDLGNCVNIAFGGIEPGLQTGYCCETGGGWSTLMIAHESQLHRVPADMSDESAVMIEPAACAVHAADATLSEPVVVLGAGTLGLLTIAALAHFHPGLEIMAVVKHPEQRRLAKLLGAHFVVEPSELRRGVRRWMGSMAFGDGSIDNVTDGVSRVYDCVGSSDSVQTAMSVLAPGGELRLIGMAGNVELDLTPLWHKEINLRGAYAYGYEDRFERRTFDMAFELVQAKDLGRLVSATYPLSRYEEAIGHAATAGARGAVKVAFDLRDEKERNR